MTNSHTPSPPTSAGLVPFQIDDFTPLPAKSLHHRGVELTRSTIIRAAAVGKIKTRLFRMPGSTKGRRYILTESLDSFLNACMVDVPITRDEAA